MRPPTTSGESWIAFLRGYGPVHRSDGMYAETIRSLALHHGQEPLRFVHPVEDRLNEAIDPSSGRCTNIVLTGTAGDGKTSLCNELWLRLSGDRARVEGQDRSSYRSLTASTPGGSREFHFLFEFSGWSPEKEQAWPLDKLDLLERFARSVLDPDPQEFFILAANDGKLLQTFDAIRDVSGQAARLLPVIETYLARGEDASERADARLAFLNLNRMRGADILQRALTCLVERDEWRCFQDEADDPAFGAASPLWQNFEQLRDARIRERMIAIAELFDANGLHVSIREILLLLINSLLGHRPSRDGVMRLADARWLATEGRAHEAALHKNLFGMNLSERRREHFAVFRYLAGFRVGQETTNQVDNLIVFGADDPELKEDHTRLIEADGRTGRNPEFERLREAYLGAEDESGETTATVGGEPVTERRRASAAFVEELVDERRRLFLRLPETSDASARYDPWELTVFRAAGLYRQRVLGPLRAGEAVDPSLMATLACGLNRIWTGMLVGNLDRIYLSTGLDFSSSRVSDIHLYEVPLRRTFHGDGLTLEWRGDAPSLRVSLGREGHGAIYKLNLVRFEFLTRVAAGALPNSFSKECTEDALAFKSQVLSAYYALMKGQAPPLGVLTPGPDGTLAVRDLTILP